MLRTQRPQKITHSKFIMLEVAFAISCFLFYTDIWWIALGETVPILYSGARYSVMLGSALLLMMRRKNSLAALPKGGWLWLFLGVCILSIVWSINTGLTTTGILRTIIQLSLFSLYMASRFNPRDQLYIIGAGLGITLLINLFYVFAIPSVGLHPPGDKFAGAWKGTFDSKNEFSGMMLLTAAVSYLMSFKKAHPLANRLGRIGLFLCPATIILSTSKSALVIVIFVYAALTILHRCVWQGRRSVLLVDLAVLFAGGLTTLVTSYWVAIAASLGKDPTMSGRTVLWAASIDKIVQKPLLGNGFDAFWSEDNPAAMSIGGALHPGFYSHSAHNGFLNIMLDTGWLGLICFLVGFIATALLAVRYGYRAIAPEQSWPFAVMLLITIYNLVESSFISEDINWLLYVITYLSIRIWPQNSMIMESTDIPRASSSAAICHSPKLEPAIAAESRQ